MFERFTRPARTAVIEAQMQARHLHDREITAEHVLLGVLADADGLPARVLAELGLDRARLNEEIAALGRADADALRTIGVDLHSVREQVEATFGPGALDRPAPRRRRGLLGRWRQPAHIPFTASAKKALEQSLRQALALKHDYIGPEHILLGLLDDDDTMASRTLRRCGIAPVDVRTLVREALQAAPRR